MSFSVRVVGVLLIGLLALVGLPLGGASAVDPSPPRFTTSNDTRPTLLDAGGFDLRLTSSSSGVAATGSITYWIVRDGTEVARADVDLVDGTARIVQPAGPDGVYRLWIDYAGDAAVAPFSGEKFYWTIDRILTTIASRIDVAPTPAKPGTLTVRWFSASTDTRYGQPAGTVEVEVVTFDDKVEHTLEVEVADGKPSTLALPPVRSGSHRIRLRSDSTDTFLSGQQTRGMYVRTLEQTIGTAWTPKPTHIQRGQLRVRGVAAGFGFSTGRFTIQIKNAAGRTVKTGSALPNRTTGIAILPVPALPRGTYTLAIHNPGDDNLGRARIEQKLVIR